MAEARISFTLFSICFLFSMPVEAGVFDTIRNLWSRPSVTAPASDDGAASPSPSREIVPEVVSSRPFSYRGPARPASLKTDQYLMFWPNDDRVTLKTYILDLNRARRRIDQRDWDDVHVNKWWGKDSINALPLFALPTSGGIVHKVFLQFPVPYSISVQMGLRVKDLEEARAAVRLLGSLWPEYKPKFTYFKATPEHTYRSHDGLVDFESTDQGYAEKDSREMLSDVFDKKRRSLLQAMTPPNQGEDFLIMTVNMYPMIYEPDPDKPGMNRQKSGDQGDIGKTREMILTQIFRKLASHDLIFVYNSVLTDFLDRGGDLSPTDKQIEFLSEKAIDQGGDVSVHGHLRDLNQRQLLAPSTEDDINRSLDNFFLGAMPVDDGVFRPVVMDLLPNGIYFLLRASSPAEAQRITEQLGGMSEVRIIEPVQLMGRKGIFERARFSSAERIISFSFTMKDLEVGNDLVSPERLLADTIMLFAKNFKLRLVDADMMALSLDQFHAKVLEILIAKREKAVRKELNCPEGLTNLD